MRDIKILVFLSVLVILVYFPAFTNFFAQDDFIFINHFSQNSLAVDIKNVFGPPVVTHWRPVHNLYFLIAGNIFGKYYFGYHLVTFIIHILTCFLIFKIFKKLFRDNNGALVASIVYGIHPAHFIAIFWISGAAVNIGFFFLILSVYCFLLGKKVMSAVSLFASLLASEAMIVGIFPIYFLNALKQKKIIFIDRFLLGLFLGSVVFVVSKILFLTPSAAFNVYQFDFSTQVLTTFKYYALRTLGFAESSGDLFASIILVILLAFIFVKTFSQLRKDNRLLFPLAFFAGIFPFLSLPDHLSPHYMVLPIFGFAVIFAYASSKAGKVGGMIGLLLLLIISFVNIGITRKNSWVVNRANLARELIDNVESKNFQIGSTLIFDDSSISTSDEAYYSLGGGEAIKFWFLEKDYKTCFTRFQWCQSE